MKTARIVLLCSFLLLIVTFSITFIPNAQVNSFQKSLSHPNQLNAAKKAELVNQYRMTLVNVISTSATVLGGVFLFLNFNQAAIKNSEEKRLSESQLTSEQFIRAAELVNNKDVYVRLCGIYSLEKLAREFPESQYKTVVEIFTAFIRKESPSDYRDELRRRKESENEHGCCEESPLHSKVKADIQVILTVIGRFEDDCKKGEFSFKEIINLSKTNLQQADLHGANLIQTNLREAYLYRADLRDAKLAGADLSMACLERADLTGADLTGADLTGANLSIACLERADLTGADLTGADLSRAYLIEAKLGDENSSLRKKTKLKGAKIIDANLRGANLIGIDFDEVCLARTFLNKANLKNANLEKATGLEKGQADKGILCKTRLPKEIEVSEVNRDC